MPLGPYREMIAFDLFSRKQRDGTNELVAFFTTPINGWLPMISVWQDKGDPDESPEDTINFMGKNIAYCISDESKESYDDLTPIDPKLVDSALMFAIGSLTRRVI